MIITVSGAACTGKTTLMSVLKGVLNEKYPDADIQFYGEFIRTLYEEYYSKKYKSFEDMLAGDPMDVIFLHKATAIKFNEIIWSSDVNRKILVFDRCPIDIGIYLYMNVAEHLDNMKVQIAYREAASYINRLVADFLNHRPTMFYTSPFAKEVVQDGFRPLSLINRRELELALFDKEFYSRNEVILLPSSLEDRIDYLDEFFSN